MHLLSWKQWKVHSDLNPPAVISFELVERKRTARGVVDRVCQDGQVTGEGGAKGGASSAVQQTSRGEACRAHHGQRQTSKGAFLPKKGSIVVNAFTAQWVCLRSFDNKACLLRFCSIDVLRDLDIVSQVGALFIPRRRVVHWDQNPKKYSCIFLDK